MTRNVPGTSLVDQGVVNWTPLTDGEEAEYRQLIQKTNWLQRHGVEAQKSAQAGLNVFEPHTLPGALAEAGGEMLPEIGLSAPLPALRLAHAAYWAGVSYLKARGSGASKAQAIGDAATAVAMLGASAPLSPLAGEAGEGWRTALAKGATRGALGVGMGAAAGAMQPGATPQSALSQGLQFGAMGMAGGGRAPQEEVPSIGPRPFDPLLKEWAEGRLAGPELARVEQPLSQEGRPTGEAVASDAVPSESRSSDANAVVQPDTRSPTSSANQPPSRNYRKTFFKEYPEYKGKVWVHHAIEQQVLKKYPGLFTEAEIHALENLRGISLDVNRRVHLRQIRRAWDEFYERHPYTATREQVFEHRNKIDKMLGHQFSPKIGQGY